VIKSSIPSNTENSFLNIIINETKNDKKINEGWVNILSGMIKDNTTRDIFADIIENNDIKELLLNDDSENNKTDNTKKIIQLLQKDKKILDKISTWILNYKDPIIATIKDNFEVLLKKESIQDGILNNMKVMVEGKTIKKETKENKLTKKEIEENKNKKAFIDKFFKILEGKENKNYFFQKFGEV
jgi:hypothetical protein